MAGVSFPKEGTACRGEISRERHGERREREGRSTKKEQSETYTGKQDCAKAGEYKEKKLQEGRSSTEPQCCRKIKQSGA